MQQAEQLTTSFPWRAATLVVGVIAAAELVALVGIGAVHFARHAPAAKAVAAKPQPRSRPAVRLPAAAPAVPTHPLRPRKGVRVLVLNGNGVQGAASQEATSLQVLGYRVGGAENAQRHDYAQSMVMYVPGWVKEARRLAHDAKVRLVAPVDGLTPAKLRGSKIVLILGS